MARRKKHPKLPNGFGSIKYLGKGRRNPYAVHPPTTEFTLDGIPKTPKALCYVNDWYIGLAVLTAYRNGSYKPGMESELAFADLPKDFLTRTIGSLYGATGGLRRQTFAEVFELFYSDKFKGKRQYSESTQRITVSAYRNCERLHDKAFDSITLDDLQDNLDNCQLKHSSLEHIKNLYNGMYAYAVPHGIAEKDLAKYVKIRIPDDDIHGVPFSQEELTKLKHTDAPIARSILVMCYSGFRISEYQSLDVDLQNHSFCGGIKTEAGRNRIVPIHSGIYEFVKNDPQVLPHKPKVFRKRMTAFLHDMHMEKHTPHDCRHTFSMLCDKYGVNMVAKKKMLGHSLKADISNGTYGHWTLEMLRPEIEKICY